MLFFIKFYVLNIEAPWVNARFNAAWVEYQRDSTYRQRLTIMGFTYAFKQFLDCPVSKQYMLERRSEKEPSLKWRIRFLPWTIPTPDIFENVARSDVFNEMLKTYSK